MQFAKNGTQLKFFLPQRRRVRKGSQRFPYFFLCEISAFFAWPFVAFLCGEKWQIFLSRICREVPSILNLVCNALPHDRISVAEFARIREFGYRSFAWGISKIFLWWRLLSGDWTENGNGKRNAEKLPFSFRHPISDSRQSHVNRYFRAFSWWILSSIRL